MSRTTLSGLEHIGCALVILLTACGAIVESDDANGQPDANRSPGLELNVDAEVCILRGASKELTVSVTRTGGFSGAVSLSVTGLPDGVSISDVVIPMGETTALVQVDVNPDTPAGTTAQLKVTGTAGSADASADVSLLVAGARGAPDDSLDEFGRVKLSLPVTAEIFSATLNQEHLLLSGAMAGAAVIFKVDSATGSLDGSFANSGRATISASALRLESVLSSFVQFDDDGRILLVGHGDYNDEPGNAESRAFLARLTPNGELDDSFGEDGLTLYRFGSGTAISQFSRDAEGRNLLAGAHAGDSFDGLIARISSDGELDSSFSDDGWQSTSFGGEAIDLIFGLAPRQNGLVALAWSYNNAVSSWLQAFDESGEIDKDFGVDGQTRIASGSSAIVATVLARVPSGYVAAGSGDGRPAIYTFGSDGAQGEDLLPALPDGHVGQAGALLVEQNDLLVASLVGPNESADTVAFHSFRSGAVDDEFGDNGALLLPSPSPPLNLIGLFSTQPKRSTVVTQHSVVGGTATLYEYWLFRLWR